MKCFSLGMVTTGVVAHKHAVLECSIIYFDTDMKTHSSLSRLIRPSNVLWDFYSLKLNLTLLTLLGNNDIPHTPTLSETYGQCSLNDFRRQFQEFVVAKNELKLPIICKRIDWEFLQALNLESLFQGGPIDVNSMYIDRHDIKRPSIVECKERANIVSTHAAPSASARAHDLMNLFRKKI